MSTSPATGVHPQQAIVEATMRSPPPAWTKAAGPVAAGLLVVGIAIEAPWLVGAAAVALAGLIVWGVVHFIVKKEKVTLRLSDRELEVVRAGGSRSYPLAELSSVREAVAKVGPNTLHVTFAGEKPLMLMYLASRESAAMVATLRRHE